MRVQEATTIVSGEETQVLLRGTSLEVGEFPCSDWESRFCHIVAKLRCILLIDPPLGGHAPDKLGLLNNTINRL